MTTESKPSSTEFPSSPKTTITFQQQGVFDDIPACYRSWRLGGLCGESIIFQKKDLKNRKDIDLIKKVKASKLVQSTSQITLSRNPPEYLFINFNISLDA